MSLNKTDATALPVSASAGVCRLSGDWNVQALSLRDEVQRRRKALQAAGQSVKWDLSGIDRLDAVGAQVLWQFWGQAIPAGVALSPSQQALFKILADHPVAAPPAPPPTDWFGWIRNLGLGVFTTLEHARMMLVLLGALIFNFVAFVTLPLRGPWREISAQIFRTGAQALGITALVGFLIGIVLSYLSAQQLAVFGAGQFIVKLLGVAIVRELGPVLAAILVAGRSGSSITAQIGVMRVTQELDAMAVMGISEGQRLILPRVIALALTMPLLVLWTDAMALIGGMLAAKFQLGLSVVWFAERLPDAIGIKNYWIGMIKGVTFGVWVALVACHFGLRIEPNTESLGKGTTASVVTAITGVILIDAIYAVIFNEMNI
ncbi:MAG: ABC transporter permease [Sheuella sp.]|nr:ABC transporter permease [Sheuella sp.]